MTEICLTKGNHKLPKETLNFSLPPIKTCPFSTPECRKWCYANKAYKQYPAVRTAWENNFTISLSNIFVEKVKEKINTFKKWNQLRIMVSGDFYNQQHLKDWCEIAKAYPNKVFYAYTKNHTLDLKDKPENFILILSDDNERFKSKWNFFDGVSKVSIEKVTEVKDWFVCTGSCKTCNECYTISEKPKRIIFNIH